MKKKLQIYLIFAIAVVLGTVSCSSKKTLQKETGSTDIILPFAGKEYQTDKENFRAKHSGKSPDLATSKKIALQNAKSELAGSIQSTIKRVTDQYTNQRSIGDKQEYENKFEELAREVVNQNISDIKISGEKVMKEKEGPYQYWVVVEVTKESVLNGLTSSISKNAKLKLDYDKKKFEEIFDTEMKKLENEQK